MNWLILTTHDLPEAYVMARALLAKSQEVALFNIRGRPGSQRLRVVRRLARKRGWLYLADWLLGRRFRSRYLDPAVRLFPEITPEAVADVRGRVRYCTIADPHAAETLRRVAELKPDYILFLGAPVIRASLYGLAAKGALNWHHGLSPRYRGSDCVLWAMARGEFDQIGCTIHEVSDVVDGGRILLQRRLEVRKDLPFTEAVAEVARQGLAGFVEVVEGLVGGRVPEARAQETGGTHYPPIGWTGLRRAHRNFHDHART